MKSINSNRKVFKPLKKKKGPSSILLKVNEGWTSCGSEGQKCFPFAQVHTILGMWHILNSLAIYQQMTTDSCFAIYQWWMFICVPTYIKCAYCKFSFLQKCQETVSASKVQSGWSNLELLQQEHDHHSFMITADIPRTANPPHHEFGCALSHIDNKPDMPVTR